MKRYQKISIAGWVIGSLLFILGIILLFTLPISVKKEIKKKLVLSKDSADYENWQTIKLPVYQKLYFFNVTNPDEIKNHGSKPILREIGPFVYREHLIKENITWNSNKTVTYKEKHVYVYQQNMTHLHENETIVSLNLPLVVLEKMLQNASPFEKFLANFGLAKLMIFKNEDVFIKHTVKEFAYSGYPDILVTIASTFEKKPQFPGTKFGWFYPQNNSDDGFYNVETGANDMSKFLYVDRWQHKKSLDYWTGSCNEIKGPVPELFPPQMKGKTLNMFVSDMCRSVHLDYDKDVTIKKIKSKRYVMPSSILANSTENKCFCHGRCYPSGVLDVNTCHAGAPLGMSLPHFYMADPQYVKNVEGLKPEKKKHEFYFSVEPLTGMTVEFAARLQINVNMRRSSWFSKLMNVPDVMFPVLWIDKIGVMTDYLSNEVLKVSDRPIHEVNIISYCLLSIGIFLLLVTTILFIYYNRKEARGDFDPLIKADDDDNIQD